MDYPQNLKLSESALIQKVSGEMVILDMESGQYYTLNEVASDMLEHIKDGLELETVIAKICEKYDTDSSEVASDLEELLTSLLEMQLVKPI